MPLFEDWLMQLLYLLPVCFPFCCKNQADSWTYVLTIWAHAQQEKTNYNGILLAHTLNILPPKTAMHHHCTALGTAQMQWQSFKLRYQVLGCSTSCRRHIQAEDGHQEVMNLGIDRSLVTVGTLVIPLSMTFWFILAWTFKWQDRWVPSYSLRSRRAFMAW